MRRFVLVLGAWTLLVGSPKPASAGLIVNGGFETGDFSGWTVSASGAFVFSSFDGFLPSEGSHFAALGDASTTGGTLSQIINDTAGQHYLLSLHLGSDGETPNFFKIKWDGTVLFDQTNLPDTRSNVSQYNLLSFPVVGTGNDTLTFVERNLPGFLALDDVSLSPQDVPDAAPEPSTFVISCIALGAIAVWRMRRFT